MSGLVWWILIGLIAGWLAGKVMKGGGYGVLVDIILGILGGILGGWATSTGTTAVADNWATYVAAQTLTGTVVTIAVLR